MSELRALFTADGFWINPRVEEYDDESDLYALMVDNTMGDKGHPLFECYYPKMLHAIRDIMLNEGSDG